MPSTSLFWAKRESEILLVILMMWNLIEQRRKSMIAPEIDESYMLTWSAMSSSFDINSELGIFLCSYFAKQSDNNPSDCTLDDCPCGKFEWVTKLSVWIYRTLQKIKFQSKALEKVFSKSFSKKKIIFLISSLISFSWMGLNELRALVLSKAFSLFYLALSRCKMISISVDHEFWIADDSKTHLTNLCEKSAIGNEFLIVMGKFRGDASRIIS